MGNKLKSAKRKVRENDLFTDNAINYEVLSCKSHGDNDDLNEPTMGEKLYNFNLTENDEPAQHENVDSSSLAKPPSADSVYILLKQALRADDRALLIDCLFRQDEKVVTNSLSVLQPSDVLKFLQSLVSIIQLRGAVLACALPWLRNLLLQHAGIIMSQESSLTALNSLYQLIESRVSNFNQALQLSSCLDLLYAETIDDGEEENDVVIPVIYEDDDESEDGGSEDSMDIESVQDGEDPAQAHSDVSDSEDFGEISD
ncbi:hypothetical protein ACJIZ3_024647 [Penstemon smallii]|uniref:Small-subunit processome Utp12 domain-containing protein n=1 Tax=Penstemon smallii TaxID=265156 RepID=A0ABD3TTS2_9LAMI